MEIRIDKKKLMFFHHILNLPDISLTKEIAETQIRFKYPGLMTECQELMTKYSLPDISEQSKLQWKKIVGKALNEYNKKSLLMKIKEYKKLEYENLKKEEFKTKQYLKSLNLADARLKFSLRARMTRTVQANYKGNPNFKANEWKCHECQVLDTQEHIVRCPMYTCLRHGKDLSSDKDLVEYFRRVIELRNKDN